MPVDFGLLKPQVVQPQMLATQTSQSPSMGDELGQFGKGLLSGRAAAQGIEANQMQIDAAKQAQADQQGLREIGGISDPAQYSTALVEYTKKIGKPELGMSYLDAEQKLRNSKLLYKATEQEMTDKHLESIGRQLQVSGRASMGLIQMYSSMAGANLTEPERLKKEQEFRKMYGDQREVLDKLAPGVYPKSDADLGKILMTLHATANVATDMSLQLSKGRPNAQSGVGKLQADADVLRARIAEAESSGQDTTVLKKNLETLEQAQQEGEGTPLDKEVAKADAGTIKTLTDGTLQSVAMQENIRDALNQLPNVSDKLLGPVIDKTQTNKLSPEVQKLISPLNAAALLSKAINGMPSNTFTEADRNFVAEIAGTTAFDKSALKSTLERLSNIAKKYVVKAYEREDKIRKGTSTYKQWKELNPAPDLSAWETPKQEAPVTDDLDAQAEAAIQAGADPVKVKQRLQELRNGK